MKFTDEGDEASGAALGACSPCHTACAHDCRAWANTTETLRSRRCKCKAACTGTHGPACGSLTVLYPTDVHGIGARTWIASLLIPVPSKPDTLNGSRSAVHHRIRRYSSIPVSAAAEPAAAVLLPEAAVPFTAVKVSLLLLLALLLAPLLTPLLLLLLALILPYAVVVSITPVVATGYPRAARAITVATLRRTYSASKREVMMAPTVAKVREERVKPAP